MAHPGRYGCALRHPGPVAPLFPGARLSQCVDADHVHALGPPPGPRAARGAPLPSLLGAPDHRQGLHGRLFGRDVDRPPHGRAELLLRCDPHVSRWAEGVPVGRERREHRPVVWLRGQVDADAVRRHDAVRLAPDGHGALGCDSQDRGSLLRGPVHHAVLLLDDQPGDRRHQRRLHELAVGRRQAEDEGARGPPAALRSDAQQLPHLQHSEQERLPQP
mmetsp:Transcript_21671/g.64528  ORF Transcript_21671/g.64528 Transcript_21671/m.64528 type:complete len:218 (-) Transcript_21671:1140-1793(-)